MVFIIVDISSTQFLDICCFSRCYFYEISQDCESTLLEIPATVVQEYPSANTQTVLEQAALSLSGLSPPSVKAPRGPILPVRSYTGDHPQ